MYWGRRYAKWMRFAKSATIPSVLPAHRSILRFALLFVAIDAAGLCMDRAMWGSDQAASVEPGGFERLVKYIRVTEASLGDGVKKIYDSERPSMAKLRRVNGDE